MDGRLLLVLMDLDEPDGSEASATSGTPPSVSAEQGRGDEPPRGRDTIAKAISSGAAGFLHKLSHPAAFLDGLRRASEGETIVVGVDGPTTEAAQRARS